MKTELLNSLRQVIKIRAIENSLVKLSLNGSAVAKKIIGSNALFAQGSLRTCNRDGINYLLDISDYMDHGIYFGFNTLLDFERENLYKLIKANDVVFDVGANIGETALNFAKHLNSSGKVFCFEPVPYLFERLKKNVSLNSFSNISLHNIALSDKKEDLFFNLPKEQNSSGTFLSETSSEQGKKVLSIPLDDFCIENKIEKLDMIKIDVEGFELKVLKGATQTLKKFKPKMFIEINDMHLHRAGGSAKEAIKLLEENNYTIMRDDNNEVINSNYDFFNKHFDIVCR